MNELTEIERETLEQETDAADISQEVEDHQEQARELEEAVSHLKAAQEKLGSEGLSHALQEAQDARRATEERLEELREQRDEMLRRNQEMDDQCREAAGRKQHALEKLPLLLRGMRSSKREAQSATPFYENMQREMEDDLRRTQDAEQDLQHVRRALENLDI